jgi:hypothetical protein
MSSIGIDQTTFEYFQTAYLKVHDKMVVFSENGALIEQRMKGQTGKDNVNIIESLGLESSSAFTSLLLFKITTFVATHL